MSSSDNLPVPRPDDDWPTQAADQVEKIVQTVHDRAIKPIETVARAIVYGLIVLAAAIVALTVLAIALVRLVNSYLPGDVWGAHLLVGGLFVVGGLVLWMGRRAPDPEAT